MSFPPVNTGKRHLHWRNEKSVHDAVEAMFGALPVDLLSLLDEPLDALSITHAGIFSIPEGFFPKSLTASLRELDLSHNSLDSVPMQITELTALRSLDISYNEVEALPGYIGALTSLQSFNASHNNITGVPSTLMYCTSLKTVNLSHNQFFSVPDTVCELTSLRSLNMSDCSLDILNPTRFGLLTQLQELEVSNNGLEFAPLELLDCVNLQSLNLDGNVSLSGRLQALETVKQIFAYLRKEDKSGVLRGKAKLKAEKAAKKKEIQQRVFMEQPLNCVRVPDLSEWKSRSKRPYWIAFLLCDVALELIEHDDMAELISIQNDIHDKILGKRKLGAVGTHNWERMQDRLPLSLRMLDADSARIAPLRTLNGDDNNDNADNNNEGGTSEVPISGAEFEDRVRSAPEEYSLKDYMSILKRTGNGQWTCLAFNSESGGDDDDAYEVISVPPAMNCAATQIRSDTVNIFVEISSTVDFEHCRAAGLAFLVSMCDRIMDHDALLRFKPIRIPGNPDFPTSEDVDRINFGKIQRYWL